MGEGLKQIYGISSPRLEDTIDDISETTAFLSSCNSSGSLCSSTSHLTEDDDETSSNTSSSSPVSNTWQKDSDGPLYELSSLISPLPVRKGLSKYFQGKSQSFTSLSDARCIEDLAKKGTPYNKRMKTCKSYARGLDATQKQNYVPGPSNRTISKKPSGVSCVSSLPRSNSSSLLLNILDG
ncbi:uncharacterized protein [Typha angustifolia]|uniref:uncharacterized protein n=1 Tax=Typha angustifolia TaxID=59011 RepID=UPI003C2C4DF5